MSEPRRLTTTRLVLLTSCMVGVQVGFAAQFNLGTPQLLHLGLNERLVSFAWIAGPLSGLVVQPLVGRLSDRTNTRFGRRRPYLVLGALLSMLSMLIFAKAKEVALFFEVPELALTLGIVGFACLDFSLQVVQGPLRMFVNEVVPEFQRMQAYSLLATFSGVGLLLGGLLTGFEIESYLPESIRTHPQAVFAFAAMVLLMSTMLSVALNKENLITNDMSLLAHGPPREVQTPTPPVFSKFATATNLASSSSSQTNQEVTPLIQPPPPPSSPPQPRRSTWFRIRRAPPPYWECFAVQLCTWVGFFTMFVYASLWIGTNVYMGDAGAPENTPRTRFETGVLFAGIAYATQAVVTILYSSVLPSIWNKHGTDAVYLMGQVTQAFTVLAAPCISGPPIFSKTLTVIDIGAYGIFWATTMSVPWTLIGNALASEEYYRNNLGLYQAFFQVSPSSPQLVVCILIAPVVLDLSGDDPAWVMFTGDIFAAMGAVLIIIFDIDGSTTRNRNRDGAAFLATERHHPLEYTSAF